MQRFYRWLVETFSFHSSGTLNVPEAEFPDASVIEDSTLVLPSSNFEPEDGSDVTGIETSTSSVVAVAVHCVGARHTNPK
jgi:hypothetical protein